MWRTVGDSYMVDASGFGADNEPALTIAKFTARLESLKKSGDNYGLAIIEAGQFQVVIQEYLPDSRDFTHSGALTQDDLRKVRSI